MVKLQNGVLSSLPYLAKIFVSYLFGIAADKLRSTGYLKITAIRKIMTDIGMMSQS